MRKGYTQQTIVDQKGKDGLMSDIERASFSTESDNSQTDETFEDQLSSLVGRRISISGHFDKQVTLEDVRPIVVGNSTGYECRVRLSDGSLDETTISTKEAADILGVVYNAATRPVDAEMMRLLIESIRIRLAYAYDRQFAVSLSGIRTLPHQIEAVYMKMLPQPRLRFLLADDPGAGKTVMAGLVIKELRLREAIDRCLILAPAPLTIQWQDELMHYFDEPFQIINSASDQQFLNQWEREPRVIASIDYAKREDVRERVWQQSWDLVIIDEAHKCSAYTKHSADRGDGVERTKRYQLAERLSERCEGLLLLTATPHHGDNDRFSHFIRLLDRDLFPEPHRFHEAAGGMRREILTIGEGNPWSIRRLKEDMKDMYGRRLFPDRYVHTIEFNLGTEEYNIYKAVTAYINEYLPQATGSRKNSVALARTVFQRRLASSTNAIYESLHRRHKRLDSLLSDLENSTPSERVKILARLRRLPDAEQDEDEMDESERDRMANETTAAVEMEHVRSEVAALADLVSYTDRVRKGGRDSKLVALRDCMRRSEFDELQDGRGKLLIFTEHRDTLDHLNRNLEEWGYSTCKIHGGMNPHERKKAQEDFRTKSQICVATEAAGEGINLQFCHLMINYDLPWNPTRLEQRLGRIHRIGQSLAVYAFNFVATSSDDGQPVIEGRILERLLSKLASMREVLGDRIFDVVGEVLSLNEINLPEMLREVAYEPGRLDDCLETIERIDPDLLARYEEATGIALARSNVDFSSFERANLEAEERRLMPRYIESHFLAAARAVGLRVEARADELWRIEHVLADLRSDRLASVRRLGKPEQRYRKVTFYKEHLEQDKHFDAALLGPGHALYGAVDERLRELLREVPGRMAVYVDPSTEKPYRIHFYEIEIRGQTTEGATTTIHAELVCIREEIGEGVADSDRYSIVQPALLIDLPTHPKPPTKLPKTDQRPISDYVKVTIQSDLRQKAQADRVRYADIARSYLKRSFDVRIRAAQDRVMELHSREKREPEVTLARQSAERDLVDLNRTQDLRLTGIDRLQVVRQGPTNHIASCLVLPSDTAAASFTELAEEPDAELKRRVEIAAVNIAIAYEESKGRECEDVGPLKIGFDIRSLAPPDAQTGHRDIATGVRRIEVKGRSRGQPIRLTTNEWYTAQQLRDTYWLYVVWDPLDNPDSVPLRIRNPAKTLDYAKREVKVARYYDLPADAVEQEARRQQDGIA